MVDAITLFDSIINEPVFEKTTVILFLNKMDLFEEKIKTVKVKDYFPSFDGEVYLLSWKQIRIFFFSQETRKQLSFFLNKNSKNAQNPKMTAALVQYIEQVQPQLQKETPQKRDKFTRISPRILILNWWGNREFECNCIFFCIGSLSTLSAKSSLRKGKNLFIL